MKPVLYLRIDDVTEVAVLLQARERRDAVHIEEREPTALEFIQACRHLSRGVLRPEPAVSFHPHLAPLTQ